MDLAGLGLAEGALLAGAYRVGEAFNERSARVLRLGDRSPGVVAVLELDAGLEARFRRPPPPIAHDDVVPVWAIGVLAPGVGFSVGPEVGGPTLDDLLEEGALAPARAVALLQGLVAAVAAVHASGELLLNLRPAVIRVLPGWGGERARIPAAGWLIGPPAGQRLGGYCAPELAFDPPEPASDQYSLGVIAYELLQGTPPHNPEAPPGERTQIALQLEGVPPALDAIVRRLLAEEPRARFPDLAALEAALAALRTVLPLDEAPTYGSFTPIIPQRETLPETAPTPMPPPLVEDGPHVPPATDSVVGVLLILLSVGAAALGLSYALLTMW